MSNEHSSLSLYFCLSLSLSLFPFCCCVQAALWMLFDEYINKVHICIDHPVDRSIFLCNCISLIPTSSPRHSLTVDRLDRLANYAGDGQKKATSRWYLSFWITTLTMSIRFRSINKSSLSLSLSLSLIGDSFWRTSGSKDEMRHLVSLEGTDVGHQDVSDQRERYLTFPISIRREDMIEIEWYSPKKMNFGRSSCWFNK